MFIQPPQRTLAPRRALFTESDFHQREFQRGGDTVLSVEIQLGQKIAFMDAASKAFNVHAGMFGWHGPQAHAHFAVVRKNQICDEVGVRLVIVLGQPREHRCEFMAEKGPPVPHGPGTVGLGERPRRIGRQSTPIHGLLKYRVELAEIVPPAGTHHRVAMACLIDCGAQSSGVLGNMREVICKQY